MCLIFGFPLVILFVVTWLLVSVSSYDKEVAVARSVGGLRQKITDERAAERAITKSTSSNATCAVCEPAVLALDCTSVKTPVLGGVDFVDFYDNTADNSAGVATGGETTIYSVYNGYTFLFASEANQAKFAKSPDTYVPQWGGFCAWGMAGEFCPEYAWSSTCLGPSGDWSLGYKYNGRSYFFYKADAREKFLADPDFYVTQGNNRWYEWFGLSTYVYSTNCYVSPMSIPTKVPDKKNTKSKAKST